MSGDEDQVIAEAFDTRQVPLRFHMLRAMDRSPRHAFFALRGATEQRETREMEVGSATHAMVFNTAKVVAATVPRNEKHQKWQDFQRLHEGCYIVTQSEYDKSARLADAIRAHHIVRELLEAKGARIEETRYGERAGRKTRCTADIWHPSYVADLKTTEDVSPDKMADHMRNYDIAGQLEWYTTHDQTPYIIAVESATCIVQVYEIDEESMGDAQERNLERLSALMECEEKGFFPSYSNEVLRIKQSPKWVKKAD